MWLSVEGLLQYPLQNEVIEGLHLVLYDTGTCHDVSLEGEGETEIFITTVC